MEEKVKCRAAYMYFAFRKNFSPCYQRLLLNIKTNSRDEGTFLAFSSCGLCCCVLSPLWTFEHVRITENDMVLQ